MIPQTGDIAPPSRKLGTEHLSIAVIGPDEPLRTSLLDALAKCGVGQVHDFLSYPPRVQDVNNLLELKSNIVIIELDSDQTYAVEIIRAVCAGGKTTVMVYSKMPESEVPESELLMRCMQAGAREFLSVPFVIEQLQESVARAALRQFGTPEPKKNLGQLMVFCAAKGGAGVTSIACNFAIALAKQPGKKTLLIDMDLPLGDVALHLGIKSRYSTIDALQNCSRVDSAFLSRLLVYHCSGLAVLPAPGRFPAYPAPIDAIDRLLLLARRDFDNVVIDAGSKFDLANGCAEYREASILYLVTQVGIPELRNANQFITHCQNLGVSKVDIVLNRYERSVSDISESDLGRALFNPVTWRIPNDFKAVRRMQDTSEPVVASDSPIARHIEAMARAASGLTPEPVKSKESGLRRWFGRVARKTGTLEKTTDSTEVPLGAISNSRTADGPDPGVVRNVGLRNPNLSRRSALPWNF